MRDQVDSKERAAFLFLMNSFESMAVGLTHDIYDRQMIKDIFGSDLLKIYEKAKKSNLINAERIETPGPSDFLIEYEKLVGIFNPTQANRAVAAIRSPIRARPRAPDWGDR